jgi:hypothetical protein
MFPNTPLTVDTLFSPIMSRKSRRFTAPGGQTPTSATFAVVDRWDIGVSKDDLSMKKYDYDDVE